MVQDRTRSALTNVLVATAAGVAGAVLFLLAARGNYLGMALSYFAPLPLMVATLGYGLAVGAGAVVAGGVVSGALTHPLFGLVLCAGLFVPAFLVCLSILIAPVAAPDKDARASRALLVSSFFAVASALALVLAVIASFGSFAAAHAAAVDMANKVVRSTFGDNRLPPGLPSESLAQVIVALAPAMIAMSTFFMLAFNAYLAGRVALVSGQLKHPWPSIADNLALPPFCAALFALACGLVALAGLPGTLASIPAAVLGAAFAVQGLAVLHVITRGLNARMPLLVLLYAVLTLIPLWPFFALSLLGFVDCAFHLRQRWQASRPS